MKADPDAMTEPHKLNGPDAARSARLRDALRENLKRRKSQARARAALDAEPIAEAPEPSGPGVAEDTPASKL